MRIAIAGPVSPYRSGIARHTTALARALADRDGVELAVFSFSRQYPAFLYPGATDRDGSAGPPGGLAVRYDLDALNPASWRRTAAAIRDWQPDVLVVPAWTFFVAPCLGVLARALRRAGVPVVMVVHNAEDHDGSRLKSALSRFQLRQASSFVTHNLQIAGDIERLAAGRPVTVQPHPVYDDYPEPKGLLPREAALELLFFGLVRPYKGLDIALRGLARSGLDDVRLTVAGEFWSGRRETDRLIGELGLSDRVEIVPRYISDAEAAEYFHRSDAVVAPYRTATGSGVLALAQFYLRPVVASDVAGLAEAVTDGRTGWLFEAGNPSAMAELLSGRVGREQAARMAPALEDCRERLRWPAFAATVIERAEKDRDRETHPGAD